MKERLQKQGQILLRLLGPLFAPTFLTSIALGIAEPVLPIYLQTKGASYAMVGVVLSALSIGRLLASLPSAGFLKQVSMRTSMLAGFAIMILALLGMALANTIALLFICWLLTGIGMTFYELARHQFIATAIANHNRGRVVSLIGGTFRLSTVFGPALGGWIADMAGFRLPFLLMAVCMGGAGLIVWRTMPTITSDSAQPTTSFSLREYGQELRQTFQQHRHILLVAGSGQLMMQLVRRTRSIIIPLYATDILGLDVVNVGLILSIGAVLDTLLFIPAGFISDRFGRKMAIIPSLLLQSLGLLLIPLTTTFAMLAVTAGFIGFGNGLSAGTMLTLGADLAPDNEQRTAFLGIWRLSNSLGFALGPNVIGGVANLLTLPLASISAGLIGFSAAFLFYQFVPETLRRKTS